MKQKCRAQSGNQSVLNRFCHHLLHEVKLCPETITQLRENPPELLPGPCVPRCGLGKVRVSHGLVGQGFGLLGTGSRGEKCSQTKHAKEPRREKFRREML